jgi:molecular chaperone DnaK
MRYGTYGLGVDIGDQTVVAAVCRHDDGWTGTPELLLLGPGSPGASAAVALVGGRLSVFPPAGPDPAGGLVEHVLQRVGAPTPLVGAGRAFSAAAAVAAIVARAHELAARREGSPAAWTVLTVPPSWGSHRRDLLAGALESAGLPRSSVVSGAVAVVRAQLATGAVRPGATVAVYDLVAGSLDTAVLRTTADGGIAELAVPPAPLAWGGRDLDDAVVGHVVGSLPDGAAPTDPAERAALRQACNAAKEALSTETDVRVDVRADGLASAVRVVREDVEDLVADAVEASVDVLRRAVSAAGLAVDDLDAVVLAGGSSRVPLVAETLSAELGRPLVADGEPALTAACGAARLALERASASEPGEEPAAAAPVEEPVATARTLRTGGRRSRRPRSPVDGGRVHASHRHLQRAAVLTTAVLALWAGSASLVAVLDPAGGGSPLGGSTAEAGGEPTPAPGAPAADPAPGDAASGGLAPVALERTRTDAAADGDRTGTRTTDPTGSTPGAGPRAAAGTVRGTASAPGPAAPAARPAPTSGTSTPPAPGTSPSALVPPGSATGTGTSGAPGSSTPPDDPAPTPGPPPVPEPEPEPVPEPEPTAEPEPSEDPGQEPPPDAPAPSSAPADAAVPSGQSA